jgi:predicted RNA binding protein YcfA (HicA-like mRNA interferase family)
MTALPRGVGARQFIRALHQDGFELARTRGSHRIYRHSDGRRVVVAYHRLSDTFPTGTLRGMIADIGWSDDDLARLGLRREQ